MTSRSLPPHHRSGIAGMAVEGEAARQLDASLEQLTISRTTGPSPFPDLDLSATADTAAAPPVACERPADPAQCERYGRFLVLRELGRGATGVVHLAWDPETDRNVAVKVIRFGDNASKTSRRLKRLFKGELTNAKQLDHPNIVQVYDGEMLDDHAWLAMEYVDGVTLGKFTQFNTLLPPHRVVGIIFKAAMALDYAARMGIIHRDIKPDNLMLAADDEVKITDFGLALDLKKKGVSDTTFIMGVGSPAYMSPEQIKDYPLGVQTDLYSLGVVLFELLTGRRPFRAKNYAQLVYKIVNMDPDRPSQLNPSVPEALDAVVKKALEKDLYSRYRSGSQMAQDLSGIKLQISADEVEKLHARFKAIRQCPTFTEFNNEEIWEILRISTWHKVHEGRPVFREDDEGRSFGVIITGEAELSRKGKRLALVGIGAIVGETAYIARKNLVRGLTCTATRDLIYLEINPAAYALASEECREHFEDLLFETLRGRLSAAYDALIPHVEAARPVIPDSSGHNLDLVPMQ